MQVRRFDADVHTFGPYTLSRSEGVLRYRGQPVAIAAKAVELLWVLSDRRGEVVSKRDIMERLWPEGFVEDGNLTQNVYLLRKLFKERDSGVSIENIPKRGYRLVAPSAHARRKPEMWKFVPAAGVAFAAVAAAVLYIGSNRELPRDDLAGAALQQYMLAESYQNDGSPEKLRQSARLFANVARGQPSSALGFAGLAVSEASLSYYAPDGAARIRLQADALTHAREAVDKNPQSADAQAALGGAELSIDHDARLAETHLRRAIEINPDQFNALAWYGSLLLDGGRIGEARRLFARAVAIAPNSAGTIASLAWCDFIAGDQDAAIALSEQQLRARREPAFARLTLANAYLQKRDFERARPQIAVLGRISGFRVQGAALAAQLDARTGRRAQALRRLRGLDARTDPRDIGSWDAASIAAAYVALRDREDAFLWLTRVEPWQRAQVFRDPRFAGIAGDPQFAAWARG